MPVPTLEQLPALAAALIRLRGDTLGRITKATGIRAANLSVWLRGKEQVISARRLVGLLHHLGVEGGHLRLDVLHQWQDQGALNDSKSVLTTFAAHAQPVWLFRDNQSELTKVHFLLAGDALIQLKIEPGIDQALDLRAVVRVDRVVTTLTPLAVVPTTSLQAARATLLALAREGAAELEDDEPIGLDDELIERLWPRMNDPQDANNNASPEDWRQLESALRAALGSGASPADIARLIDGRYCGRYGNGDC